MEERNIYDILEEREWEVRNARNWLDEEGAEFFRNYNGLPSPRKKGPTLIERQPTQPSSLRRPTTSPQPIQGGQTKSKKESASGVMNNWETPSMF